MRASGRGELADDLLATMRAAGFVVNESNGSPGSGEFAGRNKAFREIYRQFDIIFGFEFVRLRSYHGVFKSA